MQKLSRKTISEIKDTAQVEDIISDFVSLKKSGSNLVGLCPFHNEKTPSFSVNPVENLYYCFGCGAGGDAITFVREYNGMEYVDAVKYIAGKYGIPLEYEEISEEAQKKNQERESLFLTMQRVAEFYHKQLLESEEGKAIGLSYFERRGISREIIDSFSLGYAPKSGKQFTSHPDLKSISTDHVERLGLKNNAGGDFFRERAMFPLQNHAGKYIGLAGRYFAKVANSPKYINSRESEIYVKKKVLYGLFQAKSTIRKQRSCYIVEGYTDVLSMHQYGIKNVVATSGTALTEDHIQVLKRHTDEICFLFDSDKAGASAAKRAAIFVLEQGIELSILQLPEGDDPDSYVQMHGEDGFNTFSEENKRDYLLFLIDKCKQYKNQPKEKNLAIKAILHSIAYIPDALKQELYLEYIRENLKLDGDVLHEELEKEKSIQRKETKRKEKKKHSRKQLQEHNRLGTSSRKAVHYHQERDIIRVLLEHGEKTVELEEQKLKVYEWVCEAIKNEVQYFRNRKLKQIIELYIQAYQNGESLETAHFVHHENKEIQELSAEILSKPYEMSPNWNDETRKYPLQMQKDPSENYVNDTKEALLRFWSVKVNVLIEENKEDIANLELSDLDDSEKAKKMKTLLETHKFLLEKKRDYVDYNGTVVHIPN